MLKTSVNLLTLEEKHQIARICPHDAFIAVDVWTVWLSKVLDRVIEEEEVMPILAEYNQWLVRTLQEDRTTSKGRPH